MPQHGGREELSPTGPAYCVTISVVAVDRDARSCWTGRGICLITSFLFWNEMCAQWLHPVCEFSLPPG